MLTHSRTLLRVLHLLMLLAAWPALADFQSELRRAAQLHADQHYLAAASAYRRAIRLADVPDADRALLKAKDDLAATLLLADLPIQSHHQYAANLDDFRRVLGKEHPLVGYTQARLGISWFRLGDLQKSLDNLRDAYQIVEKIPGEQIEFVPVLGSWVGHVLQRQGRRDEAEQWSKRALQALEALPKPDKAAHLRHRHLYIKLTASTFVTPELIQMQQALLEDVKQHYGEHHLETLDELAQLASMHLALREWASGRDRAEQALALATRLGHHTREIGLQLRFNIGSAEMHLDNLPRARQLLHDVTVAQERKRGLRHPDTLKALAQLARVCNRQGDYQASVKLGGELIARIEHLREKRYLPPETLRHYFARWASVYRIQAHALLKLKKLPEAFRVMELARARGLRESAILYDTLESSLLLPEEKTAWEDAKMRLIAADAEVAAARLATPERLKLEKARDELTLEFSAMRAQAEKREPQLLSLSKMEVPDWQQLAGKLSSGVVYLSYAMDEDVLLVLGISREQTTAIPLNQTGTDLPETIIAYRALLQSAGPVRLRKAGYVVVREAEHGFRLVKHDQMAGRPRADIEEIGAWLGEKLLSDILAKFPQARRLVISPDHLLALLPFEALRVEGRYLIERLEVLYTPSAEMLIKTAKRSHEYQQLPRDKEILAVGGAIYDELIPHSPLISVHHSLLDPASAHVQDIDPTLEPALTGAATSVRQAMRGMSANWRNLPYTVKEIEEIANIFGRKRSTMLTYGQASEAQLQALNAKGDLDDYRYLLFTAHGYLNLAEPSLTSIVLSQIGASDKADGFLTVGELPLYRLRSDLAFISTCQSGLGRIVNGDGITGLPYALFLAGNVNSVVTLWPIYEYPSAQFSKAFFGKLHDGKDAATVLAEVKREFLRGHEFSNPVFWAGFVLYGI